MKNKYVSKNQTREFHAAIHRSDLCAHVFVDEFRPCYRRRGKIRWAKHSWFQPYEDIRGSTFAVHWPPVFITYP